MATALMESTVTKVTLNLTIEEAVLLESLTTHVSGSDMAGTPRALTAGIGIALRQAGVCRQSQGRQVRVNGSSFSMEWRGH